MKAEKIINMCLKRIRKPCECRFKGKPMKLPFTDLFDKMHKRIRIKSNAQD